MPSGISIFHSLNVSARMVFVLVHPGAGIDINGSARDVGPSHPVARFSGKKRHELRYMGMTEDHDFRTGFKIVFIDCGKPWSPICMSLMKILLAPVIALSSKRMWAMERLLEWQSSAHIQHPNVAHPEKLTMVAGSRCTIFGRPK